MSDNEIVKFHKGVGRPKRYKTNEQRHQARLQSRRGWYKKQSSRSRVKEYNKKYYRKLTGKKMSRGSKKKSKRNSKRKQSKRKLRKLSKNNKQKGGQINKLIPVTVDDILNTL